MNATAAMRLWRGDIIYILVLELMVQLQLFIIYKTARASRHRTSRSLRVYATEQHIDTRHTRRMAQKSAEVYTHAESQIHCAHCASSIMFDFNRSRSQALCHYRRHHCRRRIIIHHRCRPLLSVQCVCDFDADDIAVRH